MNTVDGSEILHQLRLVYPVIYQGFYIFEVVFSPDFLHNQQLLAMFQRSENYHFSKSWETRTHRGIWTELASWMGSSLRTSCNATSWTPFSEGRRSRGNIDRCHDWCERNTNMMRWFSIYNKSQQKTLNTDLMMSRCFFCSPTNCTVTDCGVFLWY